MLVSEMKSAIQIAESDLRRTDQMARDMADLLVGRLRQVNKDGWFGNQTLADLKRELRSYNSRTSKWKD